MLFSDKVSIKKRKSLIFLFVFFAFLSIIFFATLFTANVFGVDGANKNSLFPVENVTITNCSTDEKYNLSVTFFDKKNQKGAVDTYIVDVFDSYTNKKIASTTTLSDLDPCFFKIENSENVAWKTGRYKAEVTAKKGDDISKAQSEDFFVVTQKIHETAEFTDISDCIEDRIADIEWLYKYGIAQGSDGGTKFLPKNPVNRGAMAEFINNYANKVQAKTKAPFKDISDLPTNRLAAINWVFEEGITTGYGSPDIYGPKHPIKRTQMATFLYRLFGCPSISESAKAPIDFTDETSPHYDPVRWLGSVGITKYDDKGRFLPNNSVTRGAMAQFLKRAFTLEMGTDLPDAYSPQLAFRNTTHIAKGSVVQISTRYMPKDSFSEDSLKASLLNLQTETSYPLNLKFEYFTNMYQRITFTISDDLENGVMKLIFSSDKFSEIQGLMLFEAIHINFEGTFVGGCIKTTPHISLNFNPIEIIKTNNTQYHPEISEFLSLVSHCAYADAGSEASLNGSNILIDGQSYSSDYPLGFLKALGFKDLYYNDLATKREYNLTDKNIEKPKCTVDLDDTTAWIFGHKRLYFDGENHELIIFAIRGTNGTLGEWSSNFDLGSCSENYTKMTGQHLEWINKNNHKGFDVAANRALVSYKSYISQVIDKNAKKYILCTGHSRGGGISNLLGKEFEDESNRKNIEKAFTYTFAAPSSTTASNDIRALYKTIFNLCNKDDLVPQLPPEKISFGLYGRKLQASVGEGVATRDGDDKDKPLSEIINNFVNNSDWKYKINENVDGVVTEMLKIIKSRDNVYDLASSSEETIIFECSDVKGAQKQKDTLEELGLLKYSTYTINNTEVRVQPSPAYVCRILSLLAADPEKYALPIILNSGDTKLGDSYYRVAYKFILAGLGGLEDIHMSTTYYILAKSMSFY